MTPLDTAKAVLAKASLFDQTFSKPDLGVAIAWAEALGDIGKDDALRAVTEHYTAESRRLMPADVLGRVRRIRADRIRLAGNTEPDYDGRDVLAGLRAIREQRRQIANGAALPEPESGDGPRRADVAKLVEKAVERLPQVPRVPRVSS